VPHPPLLIPAIGGRDIEEVRSTQQGMEKLAVMLGELQPEVLIMISPHSPIYRDAFAIKNVPFMEGSFAAFQRPQIRIAKNNDMEVVEAMTQTAAERGFPLEGMSAADSLWASSREELDHGLMVPLYYLDKHLETRIVCLSISGLAYGDHFDLGMIAREACSRLGRKAFFVASGDLSHRLIRGAPAGYSPRGAEFDQRVADIAASGGFDGLRNIPEDLVQEAGECGFRSIHTMWGALKDGGLENKVLSYEGPYGVGYLVSQHLKERKDEG
jgi:aromatic ring-opening dioxygenase LigB subunit